MEFDFFLNLVKKNNSFREIYYFFNYFFGFNFSFSFYICIKQGYSPFIILSSLTNLDLYLLFLELNFFYCYNLEKKNLKLLKIDFLKKIKTYKGIRFSYFLPIRGQRTKTNAKTRKKYHII